MPKPKPLELDTVYPVNSIPLSLMGIDYIALICAGKNGDIELIRDNGKIKVLGSEISKFLELAATPEFNTTIQEDRLYTRKQVTRLLGLERSGMSDWADRRVIIPTVVDDIRLYMGDEVQRLKNMPKENRSYGYQDMLAHIPDLTEAEYHGWWTIMASLGDEYGAHLSEVQYRKMRLKSAQALYTIITLDRKGLHDWDS